MALLMVITFFTISVFFFVVWLSLLKNSLISDFVSALGMCPCDSSLWHRPLHSRSGYVFLHSPLTVRILVLVMKMTLVSSLEIQVW